MPIAPSLPLDDNEALLVMGSENWNPDDRSLGREAIRPVQVVTTDGVRPVPFFDETGIHGVRDVIALNDDQLLVTTGHDLRSVRLSDAVITVWELADAADLHELAAEAVGTLVANTGFDQGLVVDSTGSVTARHSLEAYRHAAAQPIAHNRRLGGILPGGPAPVRDDHFHFNQLALGHDGHLLAVVHHTTGYRPTVQLRQRLTGHGDGGVIDLDSGEVHSLGLHAPHSLRRISDGYTILDSGRSEVVAYNHTWREVSRASTEGWGRGFAADAKRWFVGISPTRRRYLRPGEAGGTPAVVCLDPDTGRLEARLDLDGVEQVWSVRFITRSLADRLLDLAGPPTA